MITKMAKDLVAGDVTRDLTILDRLDNADYGIDAGEVGFRVQHNIDRGLSLHVWNESSPVVVVDHIDEVPAGTSAIWNRNRDL